MNRNEIYTKILGCTLPTIYNYRKEKRLIIALLDNFKEDILINFIENGLIPSIGINEISEKLFLYHSENFKNIFNSFQFKFWSEESIEIFFDFFYKNIEQEYDSLEFHMYKFFTYINENKINYFRFESYEILSKIFKDKGLYDFIVFCIKDNFSSINIFEQSKFYIDMKKLYENYKLQSRYKLR